MFLMSAVDSLEESEETDDNCDEECPVFDGPAKNVHKMRLRISLVESLKHSVPNSRDRPQCW